MRKIIKYIGVPLLISGIMISSSCKKNSSTSSPAKTAIGTVSYTGPVAADGCGWLIKLDSDETVYSPVNLSSTYQKDSLKVYISYTILNTKTYCGNLVNAPGIVQIKIQSIAKASLENDH